MSWYVNYRQIWIGKQQYNMFMYSYFTEQLCLPLAHTRPPTSKQLDYIGEIIDEFVFCEIDHKGAKRKVNNYWFF